LAIILTILKYPSAMMLERAWTLSSKLDKRWSSCVIFITTML